MIGLMFKITTELGRYTCKGYTMNVHTGHAVVFFSFFVFYFSAFARLGETPIAVVM